MGFQIWKSVTSHEALNDSQSSPQTNTGSPQEDLRLLNGTISQMSRKRRLSSRGGWESSYSVVFCFNIFLLNVLSLPSLQKKGARKKKILFVIAAPVSALRNPLYLLTTPLSEEIPLKFLQGLAAFQLSLCTFLPLCMSPS